MEILPLISVATNETGLLYTRPAKIR
jgi:hypothetical protein